jgi:hypothetical protein
MHNAPKGDNPQNAAMVAQGLEADPGARRRRTAPADLQGVARGARLGLTAEDVRDVLEGLTADDLAGRLASSATGEWMYVFKPDVGGLVIYVKVLLRESCLVVSFHEDEGTEHEEDDA